MANKAGGISSGTPYTPSPPNKLFSSEHNSEIKSKILINPDESKIENNKEIMGEL